MFFGRPPSPQLGVQRSLRPALQEMQGILMVSHRIQCPGEVLNRRQGCVDLTRDRHRRMTEFYCFCNGLKGFLAGAVSPRIAKTQRIPRIYAHYFSWHGLFFLARPLHITRKTQALGMLYVSMFSFLYCFTYRY